MTLDFHSAPFQKVLGVCVPHLFSVSLEVGICRKQAQSDHEASQEASQLDSSLIGAGGTGAALYVMYLALFNPDVSWDRKNKPESWNKLGANEQYKFSSVNVYYSKLKKEGPDF